MNQKSRKITFLRKEERGETGTSKLPMCDTVYHDSAAFYSMEFVELNGIRNISPRVHECILSESLLPVENNGSRFY